MQHETHSMKTENTILDLAAKGTIRSNRKLNKAKHSLDENIVIYVLYIYHTSLYTIVLHPTSRAAKVAVRAVFKNITHSIWEDTNF